LTRVLRVRFRLGEFDPFASVPFSRISTNVLCSPAHRRLALETARRAIVLLQNRGDLLPLDQAKLKKIAVIGPHADIFTAGGYSGRALHPVTPLAGLRNRAAPGTELLHVKGSQIGAPPPRPQNSAPTPFDTESQLRQAAEAARTAEVAVVFVGTTLDIEAEGRDRTSLGLPGSQEALVKAVLAANPRTVVVLMSAGPLAVPWLKDHVPALLQAWWLGEEGGNAIADVLFGESNPAGRLPYTIYAAESQVPPQDQYDITQGFTYMYVHDAPLFAFGHGLSYSRFPYATLNLSAPAITPAGTLNLSLELSNTGPRDGDEVVQLYVRELPDGPTPSQPSNQKRPAKLLRGFERLHIKTGETRSVAFSLPAAKLASYDVPTHAFVVRPGRFEVMVGGSSDDIRQTATFGVQAEPQSDPKAKPETLVEAGAFKELYDPKVGEPQPWCINDHTFIRGTDGTWHVFGITHVVPFNFGLDPGKHLLHATARTLTQSPWHKEPFALTADWERHGEWLLWAPHVIRHDGLYYMFVCVGNNHGHQYKIHLLTSQDLWHWDRFPGNPLLTDGFDGRDPNVLRVGDQWVLYYTATVPPEGGNHAVACVTSPDLKHWGERRVVFTHPRTGTFGGPAESPFVVRRGRFFYLFACDGGTINVYRSTDPFHWDFKDHVADIQAHASEIVRDVDGRWYISHAGWERGGLFLAPLTWHDGLSDADTSLPIP
jgi:hypothetical protein